MLHHIIQEDMQGEFGFRRLVDAVKTLGSTYGIVKLVPFSHELVWVDGVVTGGRVPTMVWGMTTVEEVAKHYGWNPGVCKNENFDMRVLNEHYGDSMLNSDGKFCKLGEVPSYEGAMFMRPTHDTKSFTGGLINGDELDKWRAGLYDLKREFTTLDLDTEVMVASPKKTIDEARFFVVGDKVVAGSTYRVNGRVLYKSIDSGNPLFMPMWEFAEAMKKTFQGWRVCEAFVMDVARIGPDEGCKNMKIIEVNCLNSSGFYDANMTAVMKAIEYLRPWPQQWF